MVVTVTKINEMSATGWDINKRHCLHLLATHYQGSSWADRAAIFNHVFTANLFGNQARDEYGGHTAGRRNRPNGAKPTRSVQWNDHICRDEFALPGPFTQQQRVDRGSMLHRIQAAITTLGMTGNTGLGAVNLVPGMALANVALATGVTTTNAPTVAPAPTGPIATSSMTAAGPTATTSDTEDDGEFESDESCDPEEGGAAYYHVREIQREGPAGRFVFRGIPGLHYDDETPARTWPRFVRFPAMSMQGFNIRVCDVATCEVCGELRYHDSGSE